jgi:hypothetical protein
MVIGRNKLASPTGKLKAAFPIFVTGPSTWLAFDPPDDADPFAKLKILVEVVFKTPEVNVAEVVTLALVFKVTAPADLFNSNLLKIGEAEPLLLTACAIPPAKVIVPLLAPNVMAVEPFTVTSPRNVEGMLYAG